MLTWAVMKQYILEGILKDPNDEDTQYSPEQLTAYARWACAELAQHTAQADCINLDCDGSRYQFALPTDMIDTIEKCGLVSYDDGTNTTYLPVYKRLQEIIWPTDVATRDVKAYWEWPTGQLTLGFIPKINTKLILYYFRIWTPPVEDVDVVNIPQWMEQAFAYLVAAAALEPKGTQFANIRGWNRKQDSGSPEDNPAAKQAGWFVKQAQRILAKMPPQDRENFYQLDTRKTGR
jgi:hypothetical protein